MAAKSGQSAGCEFDTSGTIRVTTLPRSRSSTISPSAEPSCEPLGVSELAKVNARHSRDWHCQTPKTSARGGSLQSCLFRMSHRAVWYRLKICEPSKAYSMDSLESL